MGTLHVETQSLEQSRQNLLVRVRRVDPGHVVLHLLLIFGSLVMLLPFMWMLSSSFKEPAEILTTSPTFLPRALRWENYQQVFTVLPFGRFYINTAIVTIGRVIGQLIFASMAGFAFARLEFPGKNFFFMMVLAIMMVPSQVTLVPNYILLKYLGWLDSFQGLIIPGLFSAFGTFLLRQYFLTLPQDLEDAAVLDGCNPFQVYLRVGLPLARSSMMAFGLIVALWSWNDFLWPLIITNKTDMQMLSVGMAYFKGQYVSSVTAMMAAATVATIPMIVAFLFVQRHLIEGIMMTGMHG